MIHPHSYKILLQFKKRNNYNDKKHFIREKNSFPADIDCISIKNIPNAKRRIFNATALRKLNFDSNAMQKVQAIYIHRGYIKVISEFCEAVRERNV